MTPILPASRAAGSHLLVGAWVDSGGLLICPFEPTSADLAITTLLQGCTDEQQEVVLAGLFLLVRPAPGATQIVQALWDRAQALGLDRKDFAAAVSCSIENSYGYLGGRKAITFDLALAWVARWNCSMDEDLSIEGTPDSYRLDSSD